WLAASETGEYTFNFHHIGGCNTGVDGGGGSIERILLKVVPNSQTWSAHYQSPLLIIPQHDCLRVTGWLTNTAPSFFSVTGYLTDDPNSFRY
ncbi:hypothetical protein, partial [Thiolapillus sp.]